LAAYTVSFTAAVRPGHLVIKFGVRKKPKRSKVLIARFGRYKVDFNQRLLTRDDFVLHVTPKAFDLLSLLIKESPRVVPKLELHQRLWPTTFVSDATLAGLVKELRRTLTHDTADPIIRTAHRVGYAFCAPLDEAKSIPAVTSRWITVGAKRILLEQTENLIGRHPASTVLLDIPGVSRRHAQIVIRPEGVVLEDLGSKNGTAVGDQLLKSRPITLQSGDRIQLGSAVIFYYESDSGIPTETELDVPPPPTQVR